MRLLVVRYLAFDVAQAVIRARGNSGALCSTVAASSALTGEIDSVCSVSASVLRRALCRAVLIEYARAGRR